MNRENASATVRILADGSALIQCAASDMGPGTYTSMTMIAADALGLPVERVRFQLGDTNMPYTPVHGGSQTVASVGSAVQAASLTARAKVLQLARSHKNSPLRGTHFDEVAAQDGRLFLKSDASRGETYAEILNRHRMKVVEVNGGAQPGDEQKKFSMHAFGAHFAEVRVDPDLGEVRVSRVVGAFGVGRIINAKTARSQAIGGTVGGIGMALLEHAHMDTNFGRLTNANLAGYLVPVHADIPVLEPFFVEEYDPHVNPLGAKGVGEIAIVGVAPAIANAVYHATGKRIRDLPITPDKLL